MIKLELYFVMNKELSEKNIKIKIKKFFLNIERSEI